MITINKLNDIYDIVKVNDSFTINLSNLSIKERLRVIDFLLGITFKNGLLKKIDKDTFKVCI